MTCVLIRGRQGDLRLSSLGAQIVKYLPAMQETGLIPVSERSRGAGNGYPLQYSCLENSKDRQDWWAIVHGAAKSWPQLGD